MLASEMKITSSAAKVPFEPHPDLPSEMQVKGAAELRERTNQQRFEP